MSKIKHNYKRTCDTCVNWEANEDGTNGICVSSKKTFRLKTVYYDSCEDYIMTDKQKRIEEKKKQKEINPNDYLIL